MAKSFVPNNQADLRRFLDDLDQESKVGKDVWSQNKRWDRYAELSRGEKIWGDREYPLFRADIISPTVGRKVALLTESEPIIDIIPQRGGIDATATILKETIKALWQAQSMQMMLDAIGRYMGAFGSGGSRVIWNPEASYGLGDIELPAVDPRTARFDPSVIQAYQMDRAQYIGPLESIRPLSELQALFPDKADDMKPSALTAIVGKAAKSGFWQGLKGALKTPVGMSRGMGRGGSGGGGDMGAVPRCYVREYWVRDPATDKHGSPLFPGGRKFIRVGQGDDSIVANFSTDLEKDRTANPYFDGLWDLEWLDNTPDLDHPWGRSEVGALQYLQESFNRQGNLLVKSAIRNGYPIWTIPQNSVSPEKIRELEDLENFVIQHKIQQPPERQQPPIAFETQMALMQMTLQLTDFITGTGDMGMKGSGRTEVRSDQMLEGLQQAGQILVKAEARRLEAFLERLGKKLVSRVFQYYDDDRMLTYYSGDDTFQKYQFEHKKLVAEVRSYGLKEALKKAVDGGAPPEVEEIADGILAAIKGAWRDFSFKIVPYSSLSTTRIQRAMLRFQLASAMMIPKSDVVAEIGIANPKEKVREAIQEAKELQEAGLPPPQPDKKASGGKKK